MNYNYNPYYNYGGMYQQPQQPIMPQQKYDNSIQDIKFVTEDEAKAYIMFPNTKIMFMDRDKSVFYIKSADTLGKSTLEAYKYTKIENNPTEDVSLKIDPKEYAKIEDLKGFITKDDLKNFITREEFDILLGGSENGKQTTND